MDDTTPEFSDRQREFLNALPATSQEIADGMGISKRGVRDHREKVEEKGVDLDYDETTHIWSRADDSGDQEDTTLPEEPDPSDLTERERYILHQLQTATDTEELADDLGESPPVIESYFQTLEAKGWQIYHDETADLFEIEGDTLRSSEHKGTRTRKANRWWEKRHNELVKAWKRIDTPEIDTTATDGNEDWVVHMTDLHAGDLVRGYDDSVVHQSEDLPPIIDYITDRSLALAEKHASDYDTAYLLWGGDFVTNEGIYEGQHENLDQWLDEQTDTLHPPLMRQVKAYSQAFDNVVIICQAGNHGDIRASGSSKQANADLLLYKSIRNTVGELAEVGHCENVGFNIGRAGSPTPFWLRDGEIHGQLRHGQDRKPQAETSSRKKEWLSTVVDSLNFGQAVDIIWMGHYHVSGRIPWNGPPIFVTASPLPVGEYPRKLGEVDGLNEPDIATCHGVSDDGVTGVFPIDPRKFDGKIGE